MPPRFIDPADLPIDSRKSAATEKAPRATPGSVLDSRRAELVETVALVTATKPTSAEHKRFLDYLTTLAKWQEDLYDAGKDGTDMAEVVRQGLRALVPLVDRDWLTLRPSGLVELDEDDRALLAAIRHQRDVFQSREPPSQESAILVNLMIMTLEAVEIYIITRYGDGRQACMEVWVGIGRLLGHDAGNPSE